MIERNIYTYLDYSRDKYIGSFFCNDIMLKTNEVVDILKEQEELINTLKSLIMDDEARIEELKKENKKYKFKYNQLALYIDANFDEYMTQKKLNERIRELENELELYRHYVEFVPSSGDVE